MLDIKCFLLFFFFFFFVSLILIIILFQTSSMLLLLFHASLVIMLISQLRNHYVQCHVHTNCDTGIRLFILVVDKVTILVLVRHCHSLLWVESVDSAILICCIMMICACALLLFWHNAQVLLVCNYSHNMLSIIDSSLHVRSQFAIAIHLRFKGFETM